MSTSPRASETQTAVTLGPVHLMDIDTIKPYWRNPRRIPEDAVNALMESIRDFGYQQPIVVDNSGVIVIGHTRYAALRRLGYTKVPVLVAELSTAKIRELRLVDNKTAEYTSWDFDVLMQELLDTSNESMSKFFAEFSPNDPETANRKMQDLLDKTADRVTQDVEFVCPSCFHEWTAQVTRMDLEAGRIAQKES